MLTITQSSFDAIARVAGAKPRLIGDLKFVASTQRLENDWSEYELVSITDKAGKNGVLLLQPYEQIYAVLFEISPLTASSVTGRARAVICDFCYTWQRGSHAASITLVNATTKRRIRFLCCADLACSEHVRTRTKASIFSRTQLRENLDDTARIARLKIRLQDKIDDLALTPAG